MLDINFSAALANQLSGVVLQCNLSLAPPTEAATFCIFDLVPTLYAKPLCGRMAHRFCVNQPAGQRYVGGGAGLKKLNFSVFDGPSLTSLKRQFIGRVFYVDAECVKTAFFHVNVIDFIRLPHQFVGEAPYARIQLQPLTTGESFNTAFTHQRRVARSSKTLAVSGSRRTFAKPLDFKNRSICCFLPLRESLIGDQALSIKQYASG
jgi:hypothetical protein